MNAKRKRKGYRWLGFLILGIALLSIITAYLMKPKNAAYESINAKAGDISTFYSFSGNVESKNRQTIVSEKMMQISEIKVNEGDKVGDGSVLIKSTTGEEIKAKIAGEIVNIAVEEKAQVLAGTKLLEVVDYDNLEIKVKVDEYDISALAIGKEAEISIGAINKELQGKISNISREGQIVNGVTYFTATIDLAKDADLKIGMSAEVKLMSKQVTGVVTLPMSVIQFDENNSPYVLKKDEKGAPVRNPITVGINDGTTAEIASGVQSGETVLYTKASATNMFTDGPNRREINGGSNNG